MKTAKEYSEVLKSILKLQIEYIYKEDDFDFNERLQGQVEGLQIALTKIEQSSFLTED